MPSNERAENIWSNYDGKAQKFWSYYVSEAAQRDKHLTENWKGNMDSTLIFAGLFSAVVSAFIIESYKLLQEDSGDVTNVLLAQILAIQVAALPSNSSLPPVIPAVTSSTKFTPSPAAITVNILWFLSLVCSLAAALMMILIQQWIRDYLQRIERSSDPLRRARDRIFLSNGMERWRMDIVVHYIPTLLHISLFLFFAGLYVFLAPINRTVTLAVIPIFLCCAVLYGLITVAPLIDLSSPYETSFSSLFWRILLHISQSIQREGWWWVSPYLQRARNQLALNPWYGANETDAGALMWLYNQISNDKELERFLESLPDFLNTSNGYETFNLAIYNEENTFGQPLLLKLIFLINHHPNSTLGQRAAACIGALFPIIVEAPPKLLRRWLRSVDGLYTASISDNETMPMICFRALALCHCSFFLVTWKRVVPQMSETSMLPINVIGDARRALEDVVASIEADIPHLDDIHDLVQIYCATLKSQSTELRRWSNSLGGYTSGLAIGSGRKFLLSLQWFYELVLSPVGVEFSYNNPTMDPEVDWDEIFYGPCLLAFMHATGALEPLRHIPESSLTSHHRPSPEPGITSDEDLQTHLLREIHPLLTLLDVVGGKYQIRVTGEPNRYDGVLQMVLRAFGPLDTAQFILDDFSKGSKVVALLELIMHLRQRPDIIVEELASDSEPQGISVFRDTIDRLKIIEGSDPHNPSPACSEHLFVGVLYALLTLEREAILNNKPFVLPKSEMMNLVSFIQYFQGNDALQVAKKLFQTILTTSELLEIQDNYLVSSGPPDPQQTREQWKALHVRIVEERLLVLSKRPAILPS